MQSGPILFRGPVGLHYLVRDERCTTIVSEEFKKRFFFVHLLLINVFLVPLIFSAQIDSQPGGNVRLQFVFV